MKKYIILLLPLFLYSANFNELIKSVDTNLLIKSKQQQTKALKKLLNAKRAKNYPSVDVHVKAIRLYDTPTTIMHIPGFSSPLPMGTKTNLDAGLSVAYPLFTGFAITKSIQKAKLKVIKSKLESQELKRELYLKIASIYSNIYSLNEAIKASFEAKTAIEDSYKKAKGLYDNGFINNPIIHQIKDSFNLLFSARKPMTIFYVSQSDTQFTSRFDQSDAALLLIAAIQSFQSQSTELNDR